MKAIAAFLCGLMLGVGLIVSQMTNPAKVVAFLDVTGHWDPSLALVMGSALLAAFVGFAWVERRGRPLLSGELALPPRWPVDRMIATGPEAAKMKPITPLAAAVGERSPMTRASEGGAAGGRSRIGAADIEGR